MEKNILLEFLSKLLSDRKKEIKFAYLKDSTILSLKFLINAEEVGSKCPCKVSAK